MTRTGRAAAPHPLLPAGPPSLHCTHPNLSQCCPRASPLSTSRTAATPSTASSPKSRHTTPKTPSTARTAPGELPNSATESQTRGWMGPLEIIQSIPPPRQGHPEQGTQEPPKVGLECVPQRRALQALPGSCSSALPSSWKGLPHLR